MLKQLSQAIRFEAFFTANKQGKTGLVVTCDVYRDGTQIVTGAAGSATGGGLYSYTLAGASAGTAGNYVAVFKTTDSSVDLQHVPSLFTVGESWVQRVDENVSAAKTLTASERTAIRDAGYLTGDAFARIGANGAGLTALGDARLANIGSDTSGTTTLLSRLTATRANLLDNLDAAISSRLSAANYTAPANADIATLLSRLSIARAALLDNLALLDAAISSRLATANYSAPDNAKIADIEAVTDKLGALIENDGPDFRFTTNALELAPIGSGGSGSGPTAVQIREEMDNNSTKLAAIQTSANTLTTRLSATRAGNLDFLDEAISALPSPEEIAAEVRLELALELASIDAIESQTDKLGALIENDGPDFRFTQNALELAPTGSGGTSGPTLTQIRGEMDGALSDAGVTSARMENLDAPVSDVPAAVAEEISGAIVPSVNL